MSRRWLYIALGVLVLGLCYYGFNLFYERYEYEMKSGYSQEARRNPYLAAQLFVEQRGHKATTEASKLKFSEFGKNDAVIITNVDAMLITETQIDNALSWVENGGTLIVGIKKRLETGYSITNEFDLIAYETERFSDDLEEVLGDVQSEETTSERMRRINENIKKQQAEEKNSEQQDSKNDKQELSDTLQKVFKANTFYVNANQEKLEIELLRDFALDHGEIDYSKLNGAIKSKSSKKYSSIKWDGDEQGPRLVEFQYGKGKFIASVDLRMWANRRIGDVDHAYLLSHLTKDKGTVRIYYDFVSVSLWKLLKQHYLHTLVAFSVFLCAWLWFYGLRVQPLKQFVTNERRDFNEHLQAGASFLAEQQTTALLKPIEEDVQQQMNRFYPNFKNLTHLDQAKALIEQTQLSSKIINRWLQYCNHPLSQNQLQQALKIGQIIRNKL